MKIFFIVSCYLLMQGISMAGEIRLTFLDEFNMTSEPVWGAQTPGQLSGLIQDHRSKSYFVISDDRFKPNDPRSRGYPRFYSLRFPIKKLGSPESPKWEIDFPPQTKFVTLKDQQKRPLEFEYGDCEGIALLPNGNLAISTEGQAKLEEKVGDRIATLQPPVIYEFGKNGQWKKTFVAPKYYTPIFEGAQQMSGIIWNNGFEGLSISSSGNLYAMMEAPLLQDGGAATFDHGGLARLLKFSIQKGAYQPTAEFAYPLDAVPFPPSWNPKAPAEKGENGVSEILALDDQTFLVLERAWIDKPYFRMHLRLYKADMNDATNTLGQSSLDLKGVKPLNKNLLLDFENLLPQLDQPAVLENFEGMALTKLPDGTQGLILIADNNHKVGIQRQSLLLFRIEKVGK